jgi:hypothetical protein
VAAYINACLIDRIDLAPTAEDTLSGFSPRMTQSAPVAPIRRLCFLPGFRKPPQGLLSSAEEAAKGKLNFNGANNAHGATKPGSLRLG